MANAADGQSTDDRWTLVIRPERPWLDLRLMELWRYRDLVLLFVWRDFVATYKQTILGPLWHVVQPVLTTLTLTLIFGRIARLPTDGLPQFLFYLSGTVVWSYFAVCVTRTSTTFTSNEHVFGKVYFPRLAVPLANVMSALISFAIQFGLFLLFLAGYAATGSPVRPTSAVWLTPLLLACMGGLGLGLGIIVSAMTTRYRDLQQLVAFAVQLGMYATPVIYPLSAVPRRYRWLIEANPITALVEAFRAAFLGSGRVDPQALAYSFGCMLVILFAGVVLFNRVESTFMDTI
jgi:lipopolysaccharide transport system permease protein